MARILYGLIALFVAATVYLLFTVSERQAVLRDVAHHNDAWAIGQTVQELLRVESAVANYLLEDQRASRSEIRLRLDIAISRLASLQEGTLRAFLEKMAPRQQTLTELASVVSDLDKTLETKNEQQLLQDLTRLNALIGPMTRLSSQSIQKSWASVEENLRDLERLHLTFGVVVAFLILCWCGLLLLLLRQNRLLNHAQEQGKVLNENLRAAGNELRDKNRSLEYAAHHDALTGLPNRTLFWNELETATQPSPAGETAISLLLIDLDEFKSINDTLGHDFGDMMLHQVSERLRRFSMKPRMFCRLGGDEFACLLIDKTAEESVAYARELAAALSAPHRIYDRQVQIGCSIGVVTTEAPSEIGVQMLFKRADIALYCAKDSEDGICLFESRMQRDYDDRKLLEDDLRCAVAAGSGIDVVYQVQVHVQSVELRGVEALARWAHPTRGSISPAEFVPLAEEIGLIRDLGLLILTEACNEASTWHQPSKIAVNLSSLQLRSPDFLHTVQSVLQATGLDPRRLELEITESVLLDKREDVSQVLDQLKQLGVTVALDDFGTGYSSLAVLRDIPFDTIKLDRTFVRDIASDSGAQKLVQLVSDLGNLLGKEILIEGIETREQHEMVRHLGCDAAQGFLYGRPVPASQLDHLRRNDKFDLESIA